MVFAYVLRSLVDGGYYYGSTTDLKSRLRAHNSIDGYRWLRERDIIRKEETGELAERLLHRS